MIIDQLTINFMTFSMYFYEKKIANDNFHVIIYLNLGVGQKSSKKLNRNNLYGR